MSKRSTSPLAVVTGATGFIGPHLVRRLFTEGYRVRCLLRPSSSAAVLEGTGAEVSRGSLTDPAFVRSGLDGAQVVMHLAGGGAVSASTPAGLQKLQDDNVAPVQVLAEALRGNPVEAFIQFSSISALGVQPGVELTDESTPLPKTPHELAKFESEQVALAAHREHGLPLTILRPPQVYGPGDTRSEILKLVRLARHGGVPLFGGGLGEVPWVHVDDVVDAAMLAVDAPHARGKTYIISDRAPYRFSRVVEIIRRALGVRRAGIDIPMSVATPLVGLVERGALALHREPPFTVHRLISMTSTRRVSIGAAARDLGYNPKVSPEHGLAQTVAWYRSHGHVK